MLTSSLDNEVILALGLVAEGKAVLNAEHPERNRLLGRCLMHPIRPGLWLYGFRASAENFDWTGNPGKISSLEWMSPRILSFDAALRELVQQETVWPFGFPCLFSNWDQVEITLQPYFEKIFSFFERYRNRQEYNLLLHSPQRRKKIPQPDAVESGLGYLKLKQQAATQDEQSQKEEQGFAEKICNYLNAMNFEWREMSVGTLLSNQKIARHFVIAASADAMESLRSDTARLAETEAMQLSVTGPWPLISFIERIHADYQN